MLPRLVTDDTRVITVSERRDATDNCGGVVSIPSIIWVQSRLAKWPTWRYSECQPGSFAKCRSSTANKSATASSRCTAWLSPQHYMTNAQLELTNLQFQYRRREELGQSQNCLPLMQYSGLLSCSRQFATVSLPHTNWSSPHSETVFFLDFL